MKKRNSEQGQSLVEYVVLLVMIAGFGTLLYTQLEPMFGILESRLQDDFKFTYQLGDPKARGIDDPEGPARHPRLFKAGNFRVFGRGT